MSENIKQPSEVSEPSELALRMQDIIIKLMPRMSSMLNLREWEIGFTVGKIEPHSIDGQSPYPVRAETMLNAAHARVAMIAFNEDMFALNDDLEIDVIKTLQHELVHLVAAPMTIYSKILAALLPDQHKELDTVLYNYFIEQLVHNIEQIVLGLTGMLNSVEVSSKRSDA